MTSLRPRWSRSLAAACLAAALGCSLGSKLPRKASGPAVLRVGGSVKGGPFLLGEADLSALPQRTVLGIDPGIDPRSASGTAPAPGRPQGAAWAGVDLGKLLSDGLEVTGDAETVLVRTADLMVVSVPLSVIRQLRPVLADRVDGVRLETRVVAWPNVAQRGLASDPRAPGWWARGVVALEVVSAARTLGRALHVPEAAPPGARAGAALYGARCLACHRLQGGGGQRGPELTRAADRLSPADLRRILQRHPGWLIPGQAEPTPQAAAQLDTFLRTVAAYAALAGASPEVGDDAEGASAE